MIEFALGIFFSPMFFGGLLLLALVLDHKEARGWTVFFLLIAGFIAWSIFSLSWQTIGIAAAGWIPIGIMWSIWRWRRYCARVVTRVQEGVIGASQAKNKIDPTENKGTLVYWVFAWPISMVESVIGDVIDMVEVLVTKVFRNTYAKISANALVEIEKADKGA